MAGEGIFVRGKNGHFQIDSQFLQPIVIERSTAATVQSVDWNVGGSGQRMYWSNSWNTGNYYSAGASEISLPVGYTAGDVLIFAKPAKYTENLLKLALRWTNDAGSRFQFIAPESFDNWEDDNTYVDYVICSIRPEDGPRPGRPGSGNMGFQVLNEFDDIMYDSERETFIGEAAISGNPGVERYGPPYIEGLGMRRTEDLRTRLVHNHPNRNKEANEDVYVMMDATSMISSDQSHGNVYTTRGPKAEIDEWWCFVEWYYRNADDPPQNEDNIPEQTISLITERRVIQGESPAPNSQFFVDHRPIRTLLIGRFQ